MAGIEQLGNIGLSEKEILASFLVLDKKNRGAITFDDFVKLYQDKGEEDIQTKFVPMRKMISKSFLTSKRQSHADNTYD